ncbi:hypothetical protein GOBAR_AA09741 [Gossypium barbadense]|uniref:DUF707 domain-containing protein n=1 Tax=Gossypium barbadense TaxID=3634 RepID=A0A2P5Y5U3_GOSBA|nr:hypothetical protein GOBAR_AA09741 [Gossypium barbadense]
MFHSLLKVYLPSSHRSSIDVATASNDQGLFVVKSPQTNVVDVPIVPKVTKYIRRNPRGSKLLPPRINVPESDLHLRRLYGLPPLDLKRKPKYLAAFSVGIHQMYNIDACVKKFSEDFQIVLFHYDGKTTEWDQFEWSKKAIHVTASKQTKWFLHPDVVAAYEYIFIWDEDLGVEHFNADRYIELVKKHGLEISQPGLGPNDVVTWEMTRRREDQEVHKVSLERPGWCSDQHLPPCAAFVEIMAPVFSREAWRCVWYMIQGVTKFEKSRRQEVRIRCKSELSIFQDRLANADMAYHAQFGNG